MRLINQNLRWGYPDVLEWEWNFDKYVREQTKTDFVLAPAVFSFGHLRDGQLKDERVVYLCLEEPNGFFIPTTHSVYEFEDRLQRILTICPFTRDWGNKRNGEEKRKYVWIPYPEDKIPPQVEKDIPAAYVGNLFNGETGIYAKAAKDAGGVSISLQAGPLITHVHLKFAEKMQLLARSKVAIVHNLLFFDGAHMNTIHNHPGDLLRDNRAFERGDKEGIAPQLKTRIFESAFSGCLLLCRRDPWNLIEDWFPADEFVYFDTPKLDETLRDVLNNWKDYAPIAERARQRALKNYTCEHFFEKYLRGE